MAALIVFDWPEVTSRTVSNSGKLVYPLNTGNSFFFLLLPGGNELEFCRHFFGWVEFARVLAICGRTGHDREVVDPANFRSSRALQLLYGWFFREIGRFRSYGVLGKIT